MSLEKHASSAQSIPQASGGLSISDLKLYNYFRSSASQRVRIGLHYKGLPFEYVAVHLVKEGGQQYGEDYQKVNPMRQVPTLELNVGGKKVFVGQSMAILELLEELFPTPALLPQDPFERAKVRQLAEIVNSGIQPLQNLAVMAKVRDEYKQDPQAWTRYWMERGMQAYEREVQHTAGTYSIGDQVTIADICLAPQMNACRRFGLELSPFPTLLRIDEALAAHPAFIAARPDMQPDSE